MKFSIEDFHKNLSRKAIFGQTRPNISGTSHEDISMFILFCIEYDRRIGINREKRPLTSSCPSVCLSVSQGGSYRKDFSEIWYWGAFTKIFRETPSLVKIGQKYRASYMKV